MAGISDMAGISVGFREGVATSPDPLVPRLCAEIVFGL